ncbi:MAG: trypsin-like peptidase domain-containing protein [Acidobacteriota bacterium]
MAALAIAAAVAGGWSLAQEDTTARKIYVSAKDSVFLVYLNDSSGSPAALGSAFLVGPHLLVTNAHVVNSGTPVLAVGPARIPLTVLRIDQKNDLAIMSVASDLVSKPLALAVGIPSPGDREFAIGNPEGLENTISQGIISGIRTTDDRELLQITSPISHGSSGGPVLNVGGEVIGVAVGMMEDGQNLNFAVPSKYVRALMERKTAEVPESPGDCEQQMKQLIVLYAQWSQEDYSDDSGSPYQQHEQQILQSEGDIAQGCTQPAILRQVACFGTKFYDASDHGIAAARRLVAIDPSPDSRALLAYVLFDRAQDEDFRAAIFDKDADVKEEAQAAHKSFSAEAGRAAAGLEKAGKGNSFLVASYVMGGIKQDANDTQAAVALHALDANAAPSVCGIDLALAAYRALIAETANADHPDQAETWFRRYADKYHPAAYEWDAEGDRLQSAGNKAGAADAYERAAASDTKSFGYDYCYASSDRFFEQPADPDTVLADGRKCVDGSVTEGRDFAKKYYDEQLPGVYDAMAEVLEGRGVHDQAYEYVKSALASQPDNPFFLSDEAGILESRGRYAECISAARAAIRASDGKYAFMQEGLGDCYFDTEDWTDAEASYRIAAEADTTDASAAFNLGLSLQRQGFTVDAREWFRTALQRNPDSELRGKIMGALR